MAVSLALEASCGQWPTTWSWPLLCATRHPFGRYPSFLVKNLVTTVFVDCTVQKVPMLYKFKSKVTGDLIMLEPDAKRLLKIMGREDQVKGIFLADQLASAIVALESAVVLEELEGVQDLKQISLRQRSLPMLKMLKQCKDQSADVVWGV